MIEKYIDRVERAIEKAISDNETKLTEEIFKISGMSSRENRILLNEILQDGDKYLEIGVHKGSTFVSALYKNNVNAIAIDNFSQFGDSNDNKKWFDQNCNDNSIENFLFLNRDCFNINEQDKELIRGTNVYFYDGDHKKEDQENALTYYFDLLSNPFIFIVDDWNHVPAVEGTKSGIEKTNAIIHKEWILNASTTKKGWHNGLYLAVIGKP